MIEAALEILALFQNAAPSKRRNPSQDGAGRMPGRMGVDIGESRLDADHCNIGIVEEGVEQADGV